MTAEQAPRCSQCGDTKPLNASGVCRWRHGCEHRQFQHREAMRRLNDEMESREKLGRYFGLSHHPAWPNFWNNDEGDTP